MISVAHAQTAAAAADPNAGLMSFLPFIILIIIMYFMMIRPQMKKAKEHRLMIEALQKGDEVVTQGGLLGRVSKLGEVYVTLEIAAGVEVHLQKNTIAIVLPKGTLKTI